jgi:CPA1 family monovalent cation:H+ antiporter
MYIADILLVASGLLLVSMIAASICRHLAIPYTVLLVTLGLSVTLLADTLGLPNVYYLSQLHLTSDLVFFIFLPALIFESALSLDARALLKNIIPILTLAVIGMLISVILVAIGVWWSLGLPIMVSLLFASLISATDPVAVVALFKKLGVPSRLMVLIEGESLMNDATAIVLFSTLLLMLGEYQFSFMLGLDVVEHFFLVFFGGVFVGAVIGGVITELLVRLFHGDQSIPVVLSLSLAYTSFIVAEHILHVSGVMSVLSATIYLNIAGLSRLSKNTIEGIYTNWAVIVLICNSLLFFLIGLSVNLVSLVQFWPAILWAVLAVYIARAVSVYLLLPLSAEKVTWAERHIMWWGGLKGGLAIAIVMSIPDSLPEKELLKVLTVGVVLTSLLVNASTLRLLMRFLKMDILSLTEQAELKETQLQVNQSVDEILQHFTHLRLLDSGIEHTVESSLHETLSSKEIALSNEELIKQVHLHALRMESKEIEYLYDIGLVNYYTLVSFKSILRTDQQHSIDYLTAMGVGWLQSSILLDFEKMIIHYLSEKEWAKSILAKYQVRRFSNKILHDIAGVLMAHRALKAIEQKEILNNNKALIKPVKDIYLRRLLRRQNRLQYFSEHYPSFYHQYEAFLFQKIALRYSLKLVQKSYEEGVITAKVWQTIQKKLNESLLQVASSRQTLRLADRHGWIKKVPLFAALPLDLVVEMEKKASYVNFLPKDVLFYQASACDSLYIILSGEVIVQQSKGSSEAQRTLLKEGDLIGLSVLLPHTRHKATLIAKTYVTCLRLTKKNIIQLLRDN